MSLVISLIEGSVIVVDDDVFAEGTTVGCSGVVSVLISFGGNAQASWRVTHPEGTATEVTSVVGLLPAAAKREAVSSILECLELTL